MVIGGGAIAQQKTMRDTLSQASGIHRRIGEKMMSYGFTGEQHKAKRRREEAGSAFQDRGHRSEQLALGQVQAKGFTFFGAQRLRGARSHGHILACQGGQCCTWSHHSSRYRST